MATIVDGRQQEDPKPQQAWGEDAGGSAVGALSGAAQDVIGNQRDKMDDIRLEDVKESIAEELGKISFCCSNAIQS